MKKKINPKDQTKELSKAEWEFMKRNREEREAYEKEVKVFRDWHKKQLENIEEQNKKYPESAETIKNVNSSIMRDCDDILMETMQSPAAINGNSTIFMSWNKILLSFKENPLLNSYEENQKIYREQIIKDAKKILNSLICPHPSESLVIVVDLNRTKEAIEAEVKEIIKEEHALYHKEKNKVGLLDENEKFIRIEQNGKKERMSWLNNYPELLEVWDLYKDAGQQPVKITFKQITKIVNRPLSTVKDQWRTAYEKIYGTPYKFETKYATEEKHADATQLCAKCPYDARCYKGDDWFPCNDYIKIAGVERKPKMTEFNENILYNNSEDQ